MDMFTKKRLVEEYDEVTLRLFMEKYEEVEDILLWKEYQKALLNNELLEIPAMLDHRCKELICAHLLDQQIVQRM